MTGPISAPALPSHYACTGCGETFNFSQRDARYCFDSDAALSNGQLVGSALHDVPARPGWCKDCATVCLVEDIAAVQAFEAALGAVRAGRAVEYPLVTEYLSAQEARERAENYLRWRMGRRHPPRALCCGRTNFQFLDVAEPLLKHQECDFGVVEPRYLFSPYNGPGPGVYSAADIRVYSGEGALIGLLTWRARGSEVWDVGPAEYPSFDED